MSNIMIWMVLSLDNLPPHILYYHVNILHLMLYEYILFIYCTYATCLIASHCKFSILIIKKKQ